MVQRIIISSSDDQDKWKTVKLVIRLLQKIGEDVCIRTYHLQKLN